MGCSCRTLREEPLPRPCIAQAEPSYTSPKAVRVPETPPKTPSWAGSRRKNSDE
jgi:hypothetical protein